DIVALLEEAFERIPGALTARKDHPPVPVDRAQLVEALLGEDPEATIGLLIEALEGGAAEAELASAVSFAAATRIVRFPITNEFGDWDTALHTFTFANAVEQGLRRSPSRPLLRGIFDGAASVYLDRFLNVPATRIPMPRNVDDRESLLA